MNRLLYLTCILIIHLAFLSAQQRSVCCVINEITNMMMMMILHVIMHAQRLTQGRTA